MGHEATPKGAPRPRHPACFVCCVRLVFTPPPMTYFTPCCNARVLQVEAHRIGTDQPAGGHHFAMYTL